MISILMVEDNKDIVELLLPYLSAYNVSIANDGEEALNMFYNNKYDLILLDVMMPILDGFSVCKEVRKTSNVPVIMITARTSDEDVILGIDIGADDYIVKPFSPRQVVAKIKAMLRRSDIGSDILKSGSVFIDIANHIVKINDTDVTLTKKELEILYLLVKHPKNVYSREKLLDIIWGDDYFGELRTVDSHVKRLRSKLEKYETDFEIKTVWGVGYKYEKNNEWFK